MLILFVEPQTLLATKILLAKLTFPVYMVFGRSFLFPQLPLLHLEDFLGDNLLADNFHKVQLDVCRRLVDLNLHHSLPQGLGGRFWLLFYTSVVLLSPLLMNRID